MSVHRHVYLKFSEPYGDEASIAEVIEKSRSMLPGIPMVRDLQVGIPADPGSHAAWDLVLIVEFDSIEDVDPYREHPTHVDYYHNWMKARVAAVKAWNFEYPAK